MIVCASCGAENAAEAKFCSQCGASLPGAVQPVEERKTVTVVFCDLVGSTALAERLDPEDVRAQLSSYHARVRAELERHGGTVEKFIGDAVVAVFGAPRVHEDDAERAVRAAIAIRDWAVGDDGVDVRLAVNTGEALVSIGARPDAGEGMVAGDVINTAARLQTAAPVNGVLVGERTFRATKQRVEYERVESVAAKGKQEPVPAWLAVAARSSFGVDVDLRPVRRLVGRTRELDQLLGALARARAEREPQLVTIVGVPGIGKSRLVQELSVAVEAEPELIRWRQGRSLPYGEGVTFWALGEMVKAEAGILESDPVTVAEAKLRETMTLVVGDRDVERLHSLLQPLVGVADDSQSGDRRAEAFAAWRRFVEALAEERPTVLVFEDLHWADEGLLDFVDNLVDWATDVPLLVVATARPELLARRPQWGGGKANAATLSLAPLSDAETTELVHATLERSVLPADVQAAVLARAGGNPLYAEEFARVVADRGGASSGDLEVPDSLQGLIAARLDSLSRAEKEVLQDAAVAGKVFWPGLLTNGTRDGGELDDVLRALERKEFVRRERSSSVENELQYAFRHVLVRDIAYAQIPRATRAERHEHVAEWIARHVRGEDAAELLAHHYLSALDYARAAGRDMTDLGVRARSALRDAGRRAVALNAFRNAVRFYEAAVDLTPEDDPEWATLVLEHAEAAVYVDITSDRRLLLARDVLLAGDVHEAARTEMVLGEYLWLRGDQVGANSHFEAAEALTTQMTDESAKLRVLANIARFAMLGDEHERAVAVGRQGLALAGKLDRAEMRAHLLNSIGTARIASRDNAGLQELEEACVIAREVGGPELLRALGNLASSLGGLGHLARAAALHLEAFDAAREIGFEEPRRWLETEIAIDYMLAGEWDDARRVLAELVPSFDESPFWIEPQARVCRAHIELAAGAVDEAVVDADRAVALIRDTNSFQSTCNPLAFRARIHAELGEHDEAVSMLEKLLATWRETPAAYFDIWVVDAWLAAQPTEREADLQRALEEFGSPVPWVEAVLASISGDFRTAATTFEEVGALAPAAHIRLRAGELLLGQRREAEAVAELDRALAFWSAVGARSYVRRSEALLAAAS